MKIFGIGLERTGTTSLMRAMQMLGFTCCHFPRTTNEIDAADFSNDISVACRFMYLDGRYLSSKFILTVREEESWLDSCRRWYGRLAEQGILDFTAGNAAQFLYGVTEFNAEAWAAGRRRHEETVRDYFVNRPGDLLVLDICGGQGWPALLAFVAGLREFPRENVFE